MIPDKRKTAEEIAALREGLGIHTVTPEAAAPEPYLQEPPPRNMQAEETPPSPTAYAEAIVHLDLPPAPARPIKVELKPVHSLRKNDLPLAPATASTRRTELPKMRHDSRDISQIRKREALAALQQPSTDPAAHIRSQIASPFLYIPGYLLASASAVTAYLSLPYYTPAGLLALSAIIMIFIALRKPRSRHHAALLFIAVFLTLVFGALHYAPHFQNGP